METVKRRYYVASDYSRHPHGCGTSHERVQEVGLQPAGNESLLISK